MPSLSSRVARLERDHVGRKRKQKTEFLKSVNAIDFLERCEVANISHATADEILFSCPFPGHSHGDEKPSAYMNDGSKDPRLSTVWKCHGCGRSGNAVTFLADHEHISRQSASKKLRDLYAPGYVKPRGGSMAAEFEERWKSHTYERRHPEPKIKLLDWDMYDRKFGVDWPSYEVGYEDNPDVMYMFERGFTITDLNAWHIGYDLDSERINIPVCDPEGNLVGIKGRAWKADAKPKYLILGDTPRTIRLHGKRYKFKPYDKSLTVFGLHMWGARESYVFVEGEIDVMTLWTLGIPALCTGGAHMSEAQAKIIRDYADEIVLFLDNDNAGSNGVWGYDNEDGEHKPGIIELLEPFIRVRLVAPHKRDVNEYVVNGRENRVRRLIDQAHRPIILPR